MPKMIEKSKLQLPPYLRLREALVAAEQMYVAGGQGSLVLDSLSPILKNSAKSSSFRLKLNAMRNYGLVEEETGRVRLSQLGMSYVAPSTPSERVTAVVQAFRNIPTARTLHDRYAGGILPPKDMLANVLLREYGSTKEVAAKWADYFGATLRDADLVSSVNGRLMVRKQPEEVGSVTIYASDAAEGTDASTLITPVTADSSNYAMYTSTPTGAVLNSGPRGTTRPAIGGREGDSYNFDSPLHDGSMATIRIPKSATADDLAYVVEILGVLQRRLQRGVAGLQEVIP